MHPVHWCILGLSEHSLQGRMNEHTYFSLLTVVHLEIQFYLSILLIWSSPTYPPQLISEPFSIKAFLHILGTAQSWCPEHWQLHSHLYLKQLSVQSVNLILALDCDHFGITSVTPQNTEHHMAQNRHPICCCLTRYWFHCQHSVHQTITVVTPPFCRHSGKLIRKWVMVTIRQG